MKINLDAIMQRAKAARPAKPKRTRKKAKQQPAPATYALNNPGARPFFVQFYLAWDGRGPKPAPGHLGERHSMWVDASSPDEAEAIVSRKFSPRSR
jgi:hypothetical protein